MSERVACCLVCKTSGSAKPCTQASGRGRQPPGRQMENPAGGGITASRHRRYNVAPTHNLKSMTPTNTHFLYLSIAKRSLTQNVGGERKVLRITLCAQYVPPFPHASLRSALPSPSTSHHHAPLATQYPRSTGSPCVAADWTGSVWIFMYGRS